MAYLTNGKAKAIKLHNRLYLIDEAIAKGIIIAEVKDGFLWTATLTGEGNNHSTREKRFVAVKVDPSELASLPEWAKVSNPQKEIEQGIYRLEDLPKGPYG